MNFEIAPDVVSCQTYTRDDGTVEKKVYFSDFLRTGNGVVKSRFHDGRYIDDVWCSVYVHASAKNCNDGQIDFFSTNDGTKYDPFVDVLELHINLQAQSFEDVYSAARDGRSLILGGTVDKLPLKDRYDGGGPSEWNVEKEDNRNKPVSGVWFNLWTKCPSAHALLEESRNDYQDSCFLKQDSCFLKSGQIENRPSSSLAFISLCDFVISEQFEGYASSMPGTRSITIQAKGTLLEGHIEIRGEKIQPSLIKLCSVGKEKRNSRLSHADYSEFVIYMPEENFLSLVEAIRNYRQQDSVELLVSVIQPEKEDGYLNLRFERLTVTRFNRLIKDFTDLRPHTQIEKFLFLLVCITGLMLLRLLIK